jgi:hypothetical protein
MGFMNAWKPLLIVVPAGLVLGAVGGHLAKPVMTQHASDEAWQAMFETRAEHYGSSGAYPPQPQYQQAYVGGYSYAPFADDQDIPWSPPEPDAWIYSDASLPTVAELDARQAALLADPNVEFAVSPPGDQVEQAAEQAQAAAADASQAQPQGHPKTVDFASAAPMVVGPEPRTADGKLPAIW